MATTSPADQSALLAAELANLSYGSTAAMRGGSRRSMVKSKAPVSNDHRLNNYMSKAGHISEVKQELPTVKPAATVAAAPGPPNFVQPRLHQPGRDLSQFKDMLRKSRRLPPPPPPSRRHPTAPRYSNPAQRRGNAPSTLGGHTRIAAACVAHQPNPVGGLATSKYAIVPVHVRILQGTDGAAKAQKGVSRWVTSTESDHSVTQF